MASPSRRLVKALRETAERLMSSNQYQWGHMGSCNCGYLAQTITNLSKAEIHSYAMRKCGDWSDQVSDYCPTSGLPFDLLISEMLKIGLSLEDLKDLERLSNSEVLVNLKDTKACLKHNEKGDVVQYMLAWADLLERKLELKSIKEKVVREEMIIF